jgi:hypothetical protein
LLLLELVVDVVDEAEEIDFVVWLVEVAEQVDVEDEGDIIEF